MTMQPDALGDVPPPPEPGAGGGQGVARPTPVTVLAIIGLVLGGLGLLCKPVGLLYVLVQIPHPIMNVMREDAFIRGWTVVSVATGWLISLLLLLSSVGSLRLRDWGRTGMMAYAFLAILMTLVSRTVEWRVVEPALAPAIREIAAQQPGAAKFQLSGGKGYSVGLGVGLWFPVLLVVYFNRRDVRRAFEEGLAKAGSGI